MLNVGFLSDGRSWAYGIAEAIAHANDRDWRLSHVFVTPDPAHPLDRLSENTYIVGPRDTLNLYREGAFDNVDVLLVFGWSWMIPGDVVDNVLCICNHPSPLPKYRGGTPTQCQIIAGETTSMVSLFRMQKGMDDGPIYLQREFSMEGHLADIFTRAEKVGIELTLELLDGLAAGTLTPREQNHAEATINVRRTPADSELTPEKLGKPRDYLWNFTRMLEDPYPNAFVTLNNGVRLLLKRTEREGTEDVATLAPSDLCGLTADGINGMGAFRLICADDKPLWVTEWKIISDPTG